jgi:hypothetical protein
MTIASSNAQDKARATLRDMTVKFDGVDIGYLLHDSSITG